MRHYIVNATTGEKIEYHNGSRLAFRACCILNAHELSHGRSINYQVDPPCEVFPSYELDLPNWALNALR